MNNNFNYTTVILSQNNYKPESLFSIQSFDDTPIIFISETETFIELTTNGIDDSVFKDEGLLILDSFETNPYYDQFHSNVVLLSPLDGELLETTFNDYSTNIKQINPTTITTRCIQNNIGFYFDGLGSSYAYIPAYQNSYSFKDDNFTIECWLYILAAPDTTNGDAIIIIGNSTTNRPICINRTGSNGLSIELSTGSSNYKSFNSQPNVFKALTWHHLAITRENNKIYGFVDGIKVIDDVYTESLCDYTGNLYLSRYPWNTPGGDLAMIQKQIRITKGIARYKENFIPEKDLEQSIYSDPYFGNVELLLLGDSTSDLSLRPKQIYLNGNSQYFSFNQRYFNKNSIYFPYTSSYLTVEHSDLNLGANDFTLECWCYLKSIGSGSIIYDSRQSDTDKNGFELYIRSSGNLSFGTTVNGVWSVKETEAPRLYCWNHLCITRTNNDFNCYINGIKVSTTFNYSNSFTNTKIRIGADLDGSNMNSFYIQDLRLTKGTRYTTNFSVQRNFKLYQDELKNNVVLWLPFEDLKDYSITPKEIKSANNTHVFHDQIVHNYDKTLLLNSVYGDNLTITDSLSELNFGITSFTIELWFYYTGDNIVFYSKGVPSGAYSVDLEWAQSVPGWNTYLQYNGTTYNFFLSNNTPPKLGTWNHLIVIRNKLYVYGILNGTLLNVGSIPIDAHGDNTATAMIGKHRDSRYSSGSIQDLRITKNINRYLIEYSIPTKTNKTIIDTNNVILSLYGDSFVDYSGKNVEITQIGSIQIDSTIKLYYDGCINTQNYTGGISFTTESLSSSDFSLETWIHCYKTTTTTSNYGYIIIDSRQSDTDKNGFILYITPAISQSKLSIGYVNKNNTMSYYNTTSTIIDRTWYYIGIYRKNSIIYIYINGLLAGVLNIDNVFSNTQASIGTVFNSRTSVDGALRIQDFKLTKGIAKYYPDFTPPSLFGYINGTLLDEYHNPKKDLIRFIEYYSNKNYVTTTNNNGEFVIRLPKAVYSVQSHDLVNNKVVYKDNVIPYSTSKTKSLVNNEILIKDNLVFLLDTNRFNYYIQDLASGLIGGIPYYSYVNDMVNKLFKFFNSSVQQPKIILPGNELALTQFTISVWVYPNTLDQNGFLFEKTTNNTVNTQYSLFFESTNKLIFRTIGTSQQDLIINTNTLTVSKWNNIVATYDGLTKKIFINGGLVSYITNLTGNIPFNNSGNMYIGYNASNAYYLNGNIAQAAVYSSALSQLNIIDNFNYLKSLFGL